MRNNSPLRLIQNFKRGAFVVAFKGALRRQPALLLALCVLTLTSGCAGYGAITRNLAEDGAIVVAKIGTPWGVQEILRVGETTNTVLVEPGGRVIINPQGTLPAAAQQQPKVIFMQMPTTNASPAVPLTTNTLPVGPLQSGPLGETGPTFKNESNLKQ